MAARLLPAALVAVLLAYLLLRSGLGWSSMLVAATLALPYVIMASGRLSLAATGWREAGPLAAWSLGLIVTCLAVYGIIAAFPLTAATAFGFVAAAVVALDLALARRLPEPLVDWQALAAFALCLAFTAAWCSGPASAYEAVGAHGVLPAWQDYFIHGSFISQLGDVRAAGHQSIFLAGFPASFYHLGSYTLAAGLAGMLDQPGLPLALAAWLPLGFFTMCAGAYVLGERLGGAAGGVVALAAVAILPDASSYGLRNGLFSFHWFVLSHPGGPYALGAAFLSVAFLDRWSEHASRAALAASALLALAMVVLRAQLFVLFVPAWLAAAAFCRAARTPRKHLAAILLAQGLLAAAVGTSLLLSHLARTYPAFWRFRDPEIEKFLTIVHTWQEPTGYPGLYLHLATLGDTAFTVTAGIVLTFVAALGVFALFLPGAMALAGRFRALRPIDALPAYLALCWLLLMFYAPVPWFGDPSNLIVQPFVLLYAVAAVWTLCLVVRMLPRPPVSRMRPAFLAAALLALPMIMSWTGSAAQPKFRWGQEGAAARVEAGLAEAAAFLRKQARVGDIFAVAGQSRDYVLLDLATKLCSMSGLPTYLSRPHMEMLKEDARKRIVATRLAELEDLAALTDYGEALRTLRRLDVQWYVVAGEAGPRWDRGRRRATFSAGEIALYAARTPSSGAAFHDEMGIGNAQQVMADEAADLAELGAGKPLVRSAHAHVPAAVERQ